MNNSSQKQFNKLAGKILFIFTIDEVFEKRLILVKK